MTSPFKVSEHSVIQLGQQGFFTPVVCELLQVEASTAGIPKLNVEIAPPNVGDGGVDAFIRDASNSDYIPDGDSVWQFKSGSMPKSACESELLTATFAQQKIREGAKYILVIGGAALSLPMKQDRISGLKKAAKTLALPTDTQFEIYDATTLAGWISVYPILALDRRLGGPGPVLLNYTDALGMAGDEIWVDCPSREPIIESVKNVAMDVGKATRIEGKSGLGKTKLVLEALRDDQFASRLVYASTGEAVNTAVTRFVSAANNCILVVDECDRTTHQRIVGELRNTETALITIGPAGGERLISPLQRLEPADENEIEAILQRNQPGLPPEHRRRVSQLCLGNPRTALFFSEQLAVKSQQSAAEILQLEDVQEVIAKLLPENFDFFAVAILAMFDRVGWDRDREYQLDRIAQFANIKKEQIIDNAKKLDQFGLIQKLGRYRAIAAQPVAIYLATKAWEEVGERVLTDLVPLCDEEMLGALIRQCAELGQFDTTKWIIKELLDSQKFSSIAEIESNELAPLLPELAIVLPDYTASVISGITQNASVDQLKTATQSRRSLVFALEKLIWNRRTFDVAAESLMQLALAENETWTNNATGQWIAIFGARLPATAATPEERLQFLSRHLTSSDPEIRLLATKAAAAALDPFESATVSGEDQGGNFVEPRGTVKPGKEAIEYWGAMIRSLGAGVQDDDERIRDVSLQGLLNAVHSFLPANGVGEILFDTLAELPEKMHPRLRKQLDSVSSFATDEPALKQRIQDLRQQIAQPSLIEQIQEIVAMHQWDIEFESDRATQLTDLLVQAVNEGEIQQVIAWIRNSKNLPAGLALGRGIGHLPNAKSFTTDLVNSANANPETLVGFLLERVNQGEEDAFEALLEDRSIKDIDPEVQAYIARAAPVTTESRGLMIKFAEELPVVTASRQMRQWPEPLTKSEIARLLSNWLKRLEDETGYASVVDWLAMVCHRQEDLIPHLNSEIVKTLKLRAQFPQIGTERYDWGHLASLMIETRPMDVAEMVLQLVSEGSLMIHETDHEAAVLMAAAQKDPVKVWDLVADRLRTQDWRISLELRGWFTLGLPVAVLQDWIGDSLDNARLVAHISPVGGTVPNELARFLLDNFSDDDEVRAALAAEFSSGSWVGRWSERVKGQIEQLESWLRDPACSSGVRLWTEEMIQRLQRELQAALEREEEERFG